jgi:hypothetical protein
MNQYRSGLPSTAVVQPTPAEARDRPLPAEPAHKPAKAPIGQRAARWAITPARVGLGEAGPAVTRTSPVASSLPLDTGLLAERTALFHVKPVAHRMDAWQLELLRRPVCHGIENTDRRRPAQHPG